MVYATMMIIVQTPITLAKKMLMAMAEVMSVIIAHTLIILAKKMLMAIRMGTRVIIAQIREIITKKILMTMAKVMPVIIVVLTSMSCLVLVTLYHELTNIIIHHATVSLNLFNVQGRVRHMCKDGRCLLPEGHVGMQVSIKWRTLVRVRVIERLRVAIRMCQGLKVLDVNNFQMC